MTTERIDHAAEARKHIGWAHDVQEQEGTTERSVTDLALIAQAEATLASVEQQRIANVLKVEEISLRAQWWQPPTDIAATLGINPAEVKP